MNTYGDKDIKRFLYLGAMSSTVRSSLTPVQDGCIVYDTDENLMFLWANSQWVAQGLFGSSYHVLQNSTRTTDNQGVNLYTDVINTSTSSLPIGTYKLTVNYWWNHNSNTSDFVSRLTFDGAVVGQRTDGIIHKQEPKDSAGDWDSTGSNQAMSFTGTYFITTTTAGTKNVTLQFGTSISGVNSSIWDTSIELYRVQ